jgi:hypothetical protein
MLNLVVGKETARFKRLNVCGVKINSSNGEFVFAR